MGKQILVTGPTKSGKSEWAEQLAMQTSERVVYVATSMSWETDLDWQARITLHRQRRPTTWQTIEEPRELAEVLRKANTDHCFLVDSLGTWLANQLEQPDDVWQNLVEELLTAIADFPGTLILVAEETGWGIVPSYPSGRLFRDRLGRLTRQIGAVVTTTYLVVAGFAIDLNKTAIAVSADAAFTQD
jgi:adenosylcobinamide kinase/adenosylcobinamide-phosphate guanylyltransferase